MRAGEIPYPLRNGREDAGRSDGRKDMQRSLTMAAMLAGLTLGGGVAQSAGFDILELAAGGQGRL